MTRRGNICSSYCRQKKKKTNDHFNHCKITSNIYLLKLNIFGGNFLDLDYHFFPQVKKIAYEET